MATMPPRGQLRLEAEAGGGWAALLEDLLPTILEAMQAAGRRAWEPHEEGLGFSKATAVVREVCAGWQGVHDALVTRLVFERRMNDEAVGMVVRRFPAVVSVQFKLIAWHEVTDEGVQEVCSLLPALKSLDLSCCREVTNEGVRAVSTVPALKSLSLYYCDEITNEGVLALSSLPALTHLDLSACTNVTNEGVLALSSLPALTYLDLCDCFNVTASGVQALRSTTAAPSLHIESRHR